MSRRQRLDDSQKDEKQETYSGSNASGSNGVIALGPSERKTERKHRQRTLTLQTPPLQCQVLSVSPSGVLGTTSLALLPTVNTGNVKSSLASMSENILSALRLYMELQDLHETMLTCKRIRDSIHGYLHNPRSASATFATKQHYAVKRLGTKPLGATTAVERVELYAQILTRVLPQTLRLVGNTQVDTWYAHDLLKSAEHKNAMPIRILSKLMRAFEDSKTHTIPSIHNLVIDCVMAIDVDRLQSQPEFAQMSGFLATLRACTNLKRLVCFESGVSIMTSYRSSHGGERSVQIITKDDTIRNYILHPNVLLLRETEWQRDYLHPRDFLLPEKWLDQVVRQHLSKPGMLVEWPWPHLQELHTRIVYPELLDALAQHCHTFQVLRTDQLLPQDDEFRLAVKEEATVEFLRQYAERVVKSWRSFVARFAESLHTIGLTFNATMYMSTVEYQILLWDELKRPSDRPLHLDMLGDWTDYASYEGRIKRANMRFDIDQFAVGEILRATARLRHLQVLDIHMHVDSSFCAPLYKETYGHVGPQLRKLAGQPEQMAKQLTPTAAATTKACILSTCPYRVYEATLWPSMCAIAKNMPSLRVIGVPFPANVAECTQLFELFRTNCPEWHTIVRQPDVLHDDLRAHQLQIRHTWQTTIRTLLAEPNRVRSAGDIDSIDPTAAVALHPPRRTLTLQQSRISTRHNLKYSIMSIVPLWTRRTELSIPPWYRERLEYAKDVHVNDKQSDVFQQISLDKHIQLKIDSQLKRLEEERLEEARRNLELQEAPLIFV